MGKFSLNMIKLELIFENKDKVFSYFTQHRSLKSKLFNRCPWELVLRTDKTDYQFYMWVPVTFFIYLFILNK